MKNTNIILNLDFIIEIMDRLSVLEDDRIYCRHNLSHFFDVARICYILCLEHRLPINKDVIYSAAILHDLGRERQMTDGTSHEIASSELAKKVFDFTDFTLEERSMILSAIEEHRTHSDEISFVSLFSKADKLSRDCFNCKASDSCYWSEEKKNLSLTY